MTRRDLKRRWSDTWGPQVPQAKGGVPQGASGPLRAWQQVGGRWGHGGHPGGHRWGRGRGHLLEGLGEVAVEASLALAELGTVPLQPLHRRPHLKHLGLSRGGLVLQLRQLWGRTRNARGRCGDSVGTPALPPQGHPGHPVGISATIAPRGRRLRNPTETTAASPHGGTSAAEPTVETTATAPR